MYNRYIVPLNIFYKQSKGTKMVIVINYDDKYIFNDDSDVRVEAGGCDLYIEEPGFNKDQEVKIGHYTSKWIEFPAHIENQIRRTGELPCSKVFKDNQGKLRLYTYFD